MTNEEAIACLKKNKKWQFVDSDILDEALDMAISALSQPQGDLISREDALLCLTEEWLENYKYDELIAKFIRRIKALPSSQPDIEAIRQDIKDIMPQYADGTGWDEGRRFALKEVLHIIDKHIQNPQDHFAEVGKISVMDKTQDCDTCKHHNKTWDELPCDGCCGAHSGYEMRETTPEERQSVDDYIDSISTKKQDSKIGYITIDDYGIMNTCSVCGYSIHSKIKNFCPNCGVKLVELQKSEGEE